MSTEKENDMNISNTDLESNTDTLSIESPTKKLHESEALPTKNDKDDVYLSLTTSENDANQSYIMSDNESTSDEDDNDDSPDCPEIQRLIEEDETMQKNFEHYSNELLLVDETPEERKKIEEHPDRPVLAMRNTSSSNVMHGLIAGWILDLKKVTWTNKYDVLFRQLLALSLAMFRDDHWICDTDDPNLVYFLVKEIGDMWKNVFKKNDTDLKITSTLRKEVEDIFDYYKKLVEEISVSQGWKHPIEFIYTTSTRRKHKVQSYDLADVARMGKEIQQSKIERSIKFAAEMKKIEDEKSNMGNSKASEEPEAKKAK